MENLYEFLHENWVELMGLGLLWSAGVIAIGCGLIAAAVWKPKDAYQSLLGVRELFEAKDAVPVLEPADEPVTAQP